MSLTGAGLYAFKMLSSGGTIHSLGEIIDNSIEYGGDNVQVDVHFIATNNKVKQIIVADNGLGMQKTLDGNERIDRCLWFGSGATIDLGEQKRKSKKDIGKFGVGLPFACCGQSTNYEIFSWRPDTEGIMKVGRNHANWGADQQVIDDPHDLIPKTLLPNYVRKTCADTLRNESGTIVYWKNCDRLDYKQAETLKEHLIVKVGKMYRYYIQKGVKINLLIWDTITGSQDLVLVSRENVESYDHLFLEQRPDTRSLFDEATSENFIDGGEKVVSYTDPENVTHEIVIRASVVKESVQKPGGKDDRTGNTQIGRIYDQSVGISVVRAGREIKTSTWGFVSSTSEPRNRWWKIEVSYEPETDYLFELNANKNDLGYFKPISEEKYDPTDPRNELMRQLTIIIAALISAMMKVIKDRGKKEVVGHKCSVCENGKVIKGQCDTCGAKYENCPKCDSILDSHGNCFSCEFVTPRVCPKHGIEFQSEGHCPSCGPIDRTLSDEEKRQIESVLRGYTQFKEISATQLESLFDWFKRSGKRHFVLFAENQMSETEIFKPVLIEGQTNFNLVIVNKLHSFYSSNIEPILKLAEGGDDKMETAADGLVLLILSWAAVELEHTPEERKKLSLFRSQVGIQLELILSTWISS